MSGPSLRRRFTGRRRVLPGSAPGTVTVDPSAEPTRISAMTYGADDLEHISVDDPRSLTQLRKRWPVTWVDVVGLADVDTLRTLGETFGLHPLEIEDVINVGQRPKIEEHGDHLFTVMQLPSLQEHVQFEQCSIFFGDGFVLTFQERPGDCFEPIRERLRGGRPRIRASGADYLAYAIFDAVVDSYFPVIESYAERLDQLEEEIVSATSESVLDQIHQMKKDLFSLRRSVWPLRDMFAGLIRDRPPVFHEETYLYLRDVYDHIVQIIDLTEIYREIGSSLTDFYLSTVNQRMNEVMRVLTVIATIFIPLTFIAGIYGMNFDHSASAYNMPELFWEWGYVAVLGLMAAIGLGLVFFFIRRGWIGR